MTFFQDICDALSCWQVPSKSMVGSSSAAKAEVLHLSFSCWYFELFDVHFCVWYAVCIHIHTSLLICCITGQVSGEAKKAPCESWRNPDTGNPKRTHQGWMNRFIQLSVLTKLGKTDKVNNMLEWLGTHPVAGPAFRNHLKIFQVHGYDPDFQEYWVHACAENKCFCVSFSTMCFCFGKHLALCALFCVLISKWLV